MQTTVIGVVAFILLVFLIRSAAKIIFKLIGFIMIVALALGFLYYKSWWPFDNKSITLDYLSAQYCDEVDDEDICECVIHKIKEDMANRFSPDEIDSLMDDKLKGIYTLKKSQEATKDEAIACLKARDAEGKYQVFINDLIPIDNGILDWITSGADSIKSKVENKIDNIRDDKEDVDDRY